MVQRGGAAPRVAWRVAQLSSLESTPVVGGLSSETMEPDGRRDGGLCRRGRGGGEANGDAADGLGELSGEGRAGEEDGEGEGTHDGDGGDGDDVGEVWVRSVMSKRREFMFERTNTKGVSGMRASLYKMRARED